MKKVITTFFLLLFAGFAVVAQNIHWTWGVADANAPVTINPYYAHQAVSAYKDQALWGHILNKKYTGNEQNGDHMFNLFDTSGNLLHSTTITGSYSIIEMHPDNDGNWYVLGKIVDTIYFGSSIHILPGPGSEYFMFRLHANDLAQDWFQFLGGDLYCSVPCFTVQNNKIYYPLDSAGITNICMMNPSDGTSSVLWVQQGDSRSSSMQVDSKGNIYLTGSCAFGGLDFNGHFETAPSSFQYPHYMVRYKYDGSYDWSYFLPDVTCFTRAFTIADDNTLYYTGPLSDSMMIGQLHIDAPPAFGSFMVARLDSSGSFYWVKQLSDTATGEAELSVNRHAIVDPQNGITIITNAKHYVDWGNGVHSYSENDNLTIAHYDVQGNAQWVKQADAHYTRSLQIAGGTNAIWITGNAFDSTAIALDNITIPINAVPFAYYPFIAKLTTGNTTNNIPEVSTNYHYEIIPNPAIDQFRIAGIQKGVLNIKVSDQTGRVILIQPVNDATRINTASWARGMYFIQIEDGQSRTVRKLLLQ